jgi:hypothetical protein
MMRKLGRYFNESSSLSEANKGKRQNDSIKQTLGQVFQTCRAIGIRKDINAIWAL